MKVGIVLQARVSSNRFPKKIFAKLPYKSNVTVLERIIDRVKLCKSVDQIIVAIPDTHEDGEIERVCNSLQITSFRGSLDNVLERFYLAAKTHHLDLVIRLTGDNPCIDYRVIDELVEMYKRERFDYISNCADKTYPLGLSAELFTFSALEQAYKNATLREEFEHVTPYIYVTHKEEFSISKLSLEKSYYDIRVTLDTARDYTLLCEVYDELFEKNEYFGVDEILDLFERKPWLKQINEEIEQKKVCTNLDEEILEGIKLLKKQDLFRLEKYLKEKYYGESSSLN